MSIAPWDRVGVGSRLVPTTWGSWRLRVHEVSLSHHHQCNIELVDYSAAGPVDTEAAMARDRERDLIETAYVHC